MSFEQLSKRVAGKKEDEPNDEGKEVKKEEVKADKEKEEEKTKPQKGRTSEKKREFYLRKMRVYEKMRVRSFPVRVRVNQASMRSRKGPG